MRPPKLSLQQVADARRRYRDGVSAPRLAAENGVSVSAMRHAVTGGTWRGAEEPAVPGRGQGRRVLTAQQVADARLRAANGESIARIAAELGVGRATLGQAVRGKTWPEVDQPPVIQRPQPGLSRPAKLTAAKVANARERFAAGTTLRALAEDYGVSESAVYDAVHGRTWREVAVPAPVAPGRPGTVALGEDEEHALLQQLDMGIPPVQVAAQFGVSRTTVWRRRTQLAAKESP